MAAEPRAPVRKVVAAALAAALAASLAVPASAGTRSVRVGDNHFAPKRLTVKKGTTVRWVWKGRAPHNVAVRRGPVKFRSKVQTRGSYTRRMTRRGTYRLICEIHGPSQSMTLRVR